MGLFLIEILKHLTSISIEQEIGKYSVSPTKYVGSDNLIYSVLLSQPLSSLANSKRQTKFPTKSRQIEPILLTKQELFLSVVSQQQQRLQQLQRLGAVVGVAASRAPAPSGPQASPRLPPPYPGPPPPYPGPVQQV